MLGQVRYPSILSVTEPSFVAPLQEAIRDEFPELRAEQEVGIEVRPDGEVATEATRRWRFDSDSGEWSVVLATDFLTLEASSGQYTDYAEFRRLFSLVWDNARSILRPALRIQQGLRYVNHIPGNGIDDWRNLINGELLGAVVNPLFADELMLSLTDMRLARPDGQLAVKHGVVRAGPNEELGYVLDFDYFNQERSSQLETSVLLSTFDAYHDVIYRLFRWSITPRALAMFASEGGEQDDG